MKIPHSLFLHIPFGALLLAGMTGCSHMATYRESEKHYMAGDFKGASQVFIEKNKGEPPAPDSDGVLPNLYTGAADFMEGDFQTSLEDFERFEEGMAIQEDFGFTKRLFSGYMGKGYDAAMANAYKAISYMAKNEPDEARVEFNRAEEVSRKIAERNKEAIDENAAAAIIEGDDSGTKKGVRLFDPALVVNALSQANQDEKNKEMFDEYRHSVDEFCGAGSYENAAVFFLDGILDLFWGADADDFEGAAYTLRKAYGLSSSRAALAGAEIAENVAAGKIARGDLDQLACVFFENGLCATKESDLKTFFVPVPYKGQIYIVPVGLDLPKLVFRDQAYPNLVLRDGASILGNTLPLSSLDQIVAVEYRAEMPRVILWQSVKCLIQAVVSYAIIKTASDKLGPLGEMAATAGIAALATQNLFPADLRHWNYLPKEFQAYFLEKPESGKISLFVPGFETALAEIDLPQAGPALVYVKIPFTGARPIVIVAGPGK